MQYILTEGEYAELCGRADHERAALQETLLDLCTKVANYMPIDFGWGEPGRRPWGCIRTAGNKYGVYCDECPVRDVCPNPDKRWSK